MSSSVVHLAEAAHQRGELGEAERLYREALTGGVEDRASALYGLGTLALQSGRVAEATGLFEQARSLQPDAADINFNYALCLRQAGRTEEATSVALHTAGLCRGDAGFSGPVAALLLELGQAAAAAALLRGAGALDDNSALLLARAAGALGRWDEAVSVLRQLVERHPASAQLAGELSRAAGKLRDYPLAVSCFKRYMALTQPGADDHLRFADLYLLARDIENSAAQLELARKAGADSAEFYLLEARLARLGGDDELARRATEEALSRDSGLGQAWLVRVETAAPEELSQLVQRIEQSSSGDSYQQTLACYALADAQRARGDNRAAATALRRANTLQQAELARRGIAYDPQQVARDHRLVRERFDTGLVTAEPVAAAPVPIFVVGMPRSGTTLMEKILAQADNVTPCGENEALGFVVAQYQRDVASGALPLPADLTGQQWQQLARRYYELTAESGPVLVDKMPFNYLHVGMILSMFPSARVVQMRRDSRDIALSVYSRPFPEGHSYACDPAAIAHAIGEANTLLDHWAALDPARVIDVSFEQLVRTPAAEGRRIVEFCSLPWNDSYLDFHRSATPSFTFSERQVRRAISTGPVGQWQSFEDVLPELFSNLKG